MSSVSVEIEIDAPLQTVWDTIMDPARLHEWVSIHKSVKVRGEGFAVDGAEMDQVLHIRGFSFKVRWTLDSVRAPRTALWYGRGPALTTALISYRLSGEESGPTTFHYENEFHPPGGPLGTAASRVLVGNAPEHEARESLSRLKLLLEGQ